MLNSLPFDIPPAAAYILLYPKMYERGAVKMYKIIMLNRSLTHSTCFCPSGFFLQNSFRLTKQLSCFNDTADDTVLKTDLPGEQRISSR